MFAWKVGLDLFRLSRSMSVVITEFVNAAVAMKPNIKENGRVM